jgi:hypothetical protein
VGAGVGAVEQEGLHIWTLSEAQGSMIMRGLVELDWSCSHLRSSSLKLAFCMSGAMLVKSSWIKQAGAKTAWPGESAVGNAPPDSRSFATAHRALVIFCANSLT